ncbi:hypothetical protein ACIP39_11015 [Streptomyces tibetensis]|uniref:hypothetical protein n=1 Tax=Streptomyces tibetensis TaxID=2382123 RepID=UPI0037FD1980
MGRGVKRAVVAGSSVVASAASGLVTNVVTDRPAWPWWVALGVLVIVAVILQVVLTAEGGDGPGPGAGSVAIGGTAHEAITTRVSLSEGATAQGAGSVSVAGDARGQISTDVEASADGRRGACQGDDDGARP